MANAAEKGPITGEYQGPDAGKAFRIFDQEIQPKLDKMAEKRGETKEPWDRIKDQCNFPKRTLNYLVKLRDMEDAERDHELLALHEGMKHLKLFMPSDLVTQAQGIPADASVIPIGEAKKPKLAFQRAKKVEEGDGVDADLADAGDVVIPFGFEEPSSEALANEVADDIIENHPETADALVEDDNDASTITVTVKGIDIQVNYSDVVQPKGAKPGEMWHDAKTGLIYRFDEAENRFIQQSIPTAPVAEAAE